MRRPERSEPPLEALGGAPGDAPQELSIIFFHYAYEGQWPPTCEDLSCTAVEGLLGKGVHMRGPLTI